MWTSRLFWRPFMLFVLLIVISGVIAHSMMSMLQRQQLIDQLDLRLKSIAMALRPQVSEYISARLEDEIEPLVEDVSNRTDARITIVELDGLVVADSHRDPKTMEPHDRRMEILSAIKSGEGKSERHSDTLDMDMRYFAVRIGQQSNPVGTVRVALPTSEIDDQVSRIQYSIARLIGIVTAGGVLICMILVAWMTRPLTSLVNETRELTMGQLGETVNLTGGNEIDELGRTLNELSRELSSRMAMLEDNRGQLLATLEGMDEGVVSIDVDERIRFANDAACKMFEFSVPDDVGRPVWEVIRNQIIETTIVDVLSSGETQRVEIELLGPPQRYLSTTVSAVPGTSDGGVILVLHDITDLRRLENLRREFVANVSHELKTPLASIQAYSETLLAGALQDEENNETFVSRIVEQSERLSMLIQDLLSLARVEAGDHPFEFVELNLGHFLQDCLNHHKSLAGKGAIELRADTPEQEVFVHVDPEGMRQILDNLVDNAIKYTPPGGTVQIGVRPESDQVVITVSDSGVGIGSSHLERIFERFYRVDKARSRELGGTGLGLAIVKHLVGAFNGSVDVESRVGEGTTFTVKIPLA